MGFVYRSCSGTAMVISVPGTYSTILAFTSVKHRGGSCRFSAPGIAAIVLNSSEVMGIIFA